MGWSWRRGCDEEASELDIVRLDGCFGVSIVSFTLDRLTMSRNNPVDVS